MDIYWNIWSLNGTKIMMREPIVHQLCVGRNREKINTLDNDFHVVFALPVYYNSVVWQAGVFGELISSKAILNAARKLPM